MKLGMGGGGLRASGAALGKRCSQGAERGRGCGHSDSSWAVEQLGSWEQLGPLWLLGGGVFGCLCERDGEMSGVCPERRPLEAKGTPPKLSWEVPPPMVESLRRVGGR